MYKIRLFFFLILIIFMFSGCSSGESIQTIKQENTNLQAQVTSLKQENQSLKSQLDEIKNGAKNLYNNIQNYYKDKSYDKAKEEIKNLLQKHPDSEEAKKAKQLLSTINIKIKNDAEKTQLIEKQKKDADKKRLAESTKKMRKQYDEVQEVTWYFDKSSPQYANVNSFYVYIGTKKDSLPGLRLKIQYTADDWIFINKYIFKVDNKTFEIDTGDFGVTRDNNGDGIWELYDVELSKENYDLIKAIISSKKTIIRHQGDEHYSDRVITSTEKQGLKNVLDAYEALGGKFDF